MFDINTSFWEDRADCWSIKAGPPVSLCGGGGFLQSQPGRYSMLDDDDDDVDFSEELDLLEKMGR